MNEDKDDDFTWDLDPDGGSARIEWTIIGVCVGIILAILAVVAFCPRF
jgi:hypothetical protein